LYQKVLTTPGRRYIWIKRADEMLARLLIKGYPR